MTSNEDFLRAAFGPDWERSHVCAFPGNPDEVTPGHWKGNHAQRLNGQLTNPANNTFFSTALFRTDAKGKPSRTKATFEALYVVIVDDVGTKVDPENIALAPSWKLETSNGNAQWGFLLRAPERDQQRAQAFLDALADTGLTDGDGNNTVRYARLPVGTNNKAKCGQGGFRHALHSFDPDTRYSLDELISGFGLVLRDQREEQDSGDRDTAFHDLEDIADKLRNLDEDSPGWHDLVTRATASLVMRGLSDDVIRLGLAKCCREGFRDKDLTEAIDTARKKYRRPDPGIVEPTPFLMKAEPIGDKLLGPKPLPIPCVVRGIIPLSVGRANGPGGTIKTTTLILQACNNIVGRDVFGLPSERHGPALIISGEDDETAFFYKLWNLLDANGYSKAEKTLVAEQLRFLDVSGACVPLNELDDRGNIVISRHVDVLIDTYRDEGLAWIINDPVAYFTVGERFVNDGESAINKAGLRISKALNCAVTFIGHMSQAAAREKVEDQYAGRGGSAGADDARGVMNFHSFTEGQTATYPPPPGISKAGIVGGRVFRINFPKFSHGPREQRYLFVERGDMANPWRFDLVWSDKPTAEAVKEAQQRALDERLNKLVPAVVEAVTRLDDPTPNEVATYLQDSLADVSRDTARAAVERAVETGAALKEERPKGQRQHNRLWRLRCP